MFEQAVEAFMTLNVYVKLRVLVALALYPPLMWQILTRRVEQNLATFILWGLLDVIAAASLYVRGGNWFLPAAYVGGCMLVIAGLIYVRTVNWTWFETAISFMVIVCLIGWTQSGPRMAAILSTTGVGLASLPQLWDTIKNPTSSPLLIYTGFTIANTLNAVGGKNWSVEERLYPVVCTILCLAIVIAACRRFTGAAKVILQT